MPAGAQKVAFLFPTLRLTRKPLGAGRIDSIDLQGKQFTVRVVFPTCALARSLREKVRQQRLNSANPVRRLATPPPVSIIGTMMAPSAVSLGARQISLARASSTLFRTVPSQMLVARRGYATPAGPPPKNFRLKPPTAWDQEKESTFDRVGKYFLLTEMFRGMYILMEQFFRPPWVLPE